MKRLSFIIALALVLTIGGVYATFNYAGNQDTIDEVVINNIGKELAEAKVIDSKKGTLTVDVAQDFLIKVDDINGNLRTVGSYTKPEMKITFTPDPSSATETRTKGINLKLTFTNGKYNNKDIFTIKDSKGNVCTDSVVQLSRDEGERQDDGSFVFTLDLSKYITVTEFELPTKKDYDNYAEAFGQFALSITVEENIPTSNP